MAIFAASGDAGSEDCFPQDDSTSLAVDYPGSDPEVTSVGGTTLTQGSEVVWNDCLSDEGPSCAETDAHGAGGGGISRVESQPSYQSVVGSASGREVPDVSANAGTPMVFYDAGIGGSVAEIVGRELRALGARGQVLCVTHLPQVASLAHHHLQVMKLTDGRSTRTTLTELTAEERIEELARMLGGIEVSARAREHAREMLAILAGPKGAPAGAAAAPQEGGDTVRQRRPPRVKKL